MQLFQRALPLSAFLFFVVVVLSGTGQTAAAASIVMGDNTILTTTSSGIANTLIAQQATLSQPATLQSLSFYVGTPRGNLRLGVYDATGPGGGPGNKIAETVSLTPVAGWNSAAVTPVALQAGTYWLAYLDNNNSLALRFALTGTSRYYTFSFGTLPATFSATPSVSNAHASFYGTLVTATDTTPPSVSVSTPANGANVSGTVSVSASASDNVGVTGVQFFLDSATLGAQDIASPYSVSWNTTSISNGAHTLAARARDAAGNAATSTILVTVANAATISGQAVSSITQSGATVAWNTNQAATSQVEYGLTTAYGQITPVDTALVTAHSVAISGLVSNTLYNYRVHSKNAQGVETIGPNATFKTAVAPDTQAPSVPAGLGATTTSSSQINLIWNPSTDNVGVAGYKVFRNGSQIATTTAVSFSNTGLAANTTYMYAVAAFDAAGNASGLSNTVQATTTPPDATIHLGILGDSASDEYRADDNRGGAYAETTLNWVELLVRYRGLDVGPWGNWGGTRRSGYEYNWALSGATAEDVVSQGQPQGLAAQVAAGKVNTVILYVGANDFAIWNGTFQAIYDGSLSGQALTDHLNTIIQDYATAIDIVRAAGPVNMIVTTVADRSRGPTFIATFPDPVRRQAVSNAIAMVDAGIQSVVDARPGVVLVDFFNPLSDPDILPRIDKDSNFIVGGQVIQSQADGDEPHHVIIGDHDHTGTVGGGLLANFLFVDTVDAHFGGTLVPFTDQEILTNAGIFPGVNWPSTPTNLVAVATSSSQINLTWNPSTDNAGISQYLISRNGVTVGSSNATSFSDTGLVASTTYAYTVTAVDTAGNASTYSATASSTTLSGPNNPPPGPITVGETALFSPNGGAANLAVAQDATLAQSATLQSMSFYVTAPAGSLRLGVYNSAGPGGGPGALVAQTNSFVPIAGWNTQNVISQVRLQPGTYWLAFVNNNSALGFSIEMTSGNYRIASSAFGPLPATFSSIQSGIAHLSIYATLQP